MNRLIERFIEYCKIDTQSMDNSPTSPSTMKQFDLAKLLVKQLHELGVDNAYVDEHCYVYATIYGKKATKDTVGFIAHMDTADFNGHGVKPRLITNYDGKDIRLNEEYVLSPAEFASLKQHVGKNLIVTDGTTLLGADDKAGIAAIMETVAYYHDHPELDHPTFKIAFTPDEEVGRGTEHFDVEKFGCDYAFTLDGGEIWEVCDETFNAAGAVVKIKGFSIHPGSAKGKMINASNVAIEFINMLDHNKRPEYTSDYEGFYHLESFKGNVEEATLDFILRDHDENKLAQMIQVMQQAAEFINLRYGQPIVQVDITHQYKNMYSILKDHQHITNLAFEALKELNVQGKKVPVRGGTDGANLTFMGLPCPNLGTGGYNYHGRYEYLVVQELMLAQQLIVKILEKIS
ncbi:MAG: peptidase T [Erysipelotrichaceae bacterium]|nr:peptidase T [Erysipelotrichaceae bacterium]MDY5252008.1 peptidase T [Erysipelotrichaceae bacterium]